MSHSDTKDFGAYNDVRPHVFDPALNPELFEGVMARRVIAFLIDVTIISLPVIFATIFILIFGVITLGLGWMLFWILGPAAMVWALVYYGVTLGGPHSATLGMRVMDIEMRTWYGAPAYFVLGAVHAALYWVSVSFLTPFVLLVPFFNPRSRTLHDIALGTVIINNPARTEALVRAHPEASPR